ncbi:MAG: hypothetical protein R3F25_08835 [Gammaproteobacteria bacterium]|jgi:hypothetical protein|nr:hypothetical protein [Xanthomonadales bacterium]
MFLRKITKHIQNQNWFAVWVDFIIVVAGVFIGIQVANWNEQRSLFQKETQLLNELKKEIQSSITLTESKIQAYQQATDAGKRVLSYLDTQKTCEENCWNLIVDFMHASQWQDIHINSSTYHNMRDNGFPTNRGIIDAVEAYLAQNSNNADPFSALPVYRSLVRQIINIKTQEFYWKYCWSLKDGIEKYNLNCPKGISDEESKSLVTEIIENPGIRPNLTEWTGAIVSLPTTLGEQNVAARKAIDLIDEELRHR